ncbi:MAG: mRNA-degrading endonuclease [Chloroflexi bacterium]|nr:mRNA-degrading endonuclease [Chloroflexota bacterium]MYB17048.1 mRNA-degrading endonuclease [Chloroflexota bacterium]MYC48195.1 mRNA-degrading endonuclease [Chloroflexota bacterium]
MVDGEPVPGRGDIVWLRFADQVGHEQAGRRHALILSPRSYNERSSVALACPITTRIRAWPFEVKLPPNGPVTGVVIADQIRSLDWRHRGARLATRAPRSVVAEVLQKVRLLLD